MKATLIFALATAASVMLPSGVNHAQTAATRTATSPQDTLARSLDEQAISAHGLGVDTDSGSAILSGVNAVWQPLELTFQGPSADELDTDPNPFSDFRMVVRLTAPSGKQLFISGFFDGDGMGGSSGNVWKARFVLDEAGSWNYLASFVRGKGIALSKDPLAGAPLSFNGSTGSISVAPRDPSAPGFLKWGLLEDVGKPYLRFRDGIYFVKTGVAGPENFLGYLGFDDTYDYPGGGNTSGLSNGLHRYGPHESDWRNGDPLFSSSTSGVDSRGIIGALNYLSDSGVNALSFLVLNMDGNGNETTPFVSNVNGVQSKRHFDISKLHQWNQVFEHAQRKGIALQLFLSEADGSNVLYLDGGQFSVEHQLYFREMVARFGHLLALQWNLCQENVKPDNVLIRATEWLQFLDAYDHPIAFQTRPLPQSGGFGQYGRALGASPLASASLVSFDDDAGDHVELWRSASDQAGRPWAVSLDAVLPDFTGLSGTNASDLRKSTLYDVLFSGGSIEWSLGEHNLPTGGELRLEDFRTRAEMFDYAFNARAFIQSSLRYWEMEPADHLVSGESNAFGGAEVFAKEGELYAVYYPDATQTGTLDLSNAPGTYELEWFDPKNGSFEGSVQTVSGGGTVSVGEPPVVTGTGPSVYQAVNDVVVVEIESHPPSGDWTPQTSVPGYTGSEYYNWTGPDLFNSPGSGVMSWDFYVPKAGNYEVRIRNFHDYHDVSEENDCWLSVDGSSWIKVYSGEKDKWTWFTRFDPGHKDANYDLQPGVHTLRISGRSNNFRIDRWHVYLDGANNPLDKTAPQSPFAPVGGGPVEDWVLLVTRK